MASNNHKTTRVVRAPIRDKKAASLPQKKGDPSDASLAAKGMAPKNASKTSPGKVSEAKNIEQDRPVRGKTPTGVPGSKPGATSKTRPQGTSKPSISNAVNGLEDPFYSPIKPRYSTYDNKVIEFKNVTKIYHLFKNDRGRILSVFNQKKNKKGFHGGLVVQNLFFRSKKKGIYMGSIKATNNLSFEVTRGEAVAFLGANGAGKSTTAKMVTGVTHPTVGKVFVRGRVSALLELTAGFDPKLSGRENITMRGHIMGMDKKEIEDLHKRVVDFAELGPYIDQAVRTYSSGMKARLGFAFAISISPEILVIDETLSVGDKDFKEKCTKRIREIIKDENVTVLFISHSISLVKEFCSRGIVLLEGKKVFDGPINKAVHYYETHC